jgi:hypothetical protein
MGYYLVLSAGGSNIGVTIRISGNDCLQTPFIVVALSTELKVAICVSHLIVSAFKIGIFGAAAQILCQLIEEEGGQEVPAIGTEADAYCCSHTQVDHEIQKYSDEDASNEQATGKESLQMA